MRNRLIGWSAVVAAGSALLMALAAPAANAQGDDWRYNRDRNFDRDRGGIRHEVYDLRRDEQRLHDLQLQRQREVDRRDWHDVHILNDRIAELRAHMAADRARLHDRFDDHHDWNNRRDWNDRRDWR